MNTKKHTDNSKPTQKHMKLETFQWILGLPLNLDRHEMAQQIAHQIEHQLRYTYSKLGFFEENKEQYYGLFRNL